MATNLITTDDNTIVVFTSDHGEMMGAHRIMNKCVMYEEAVRVPFFIRLPGKAPAGRVSGPVSQVDIVPTLLDLMGFDRPGHLQGKSLRPLVEDRDGGRRPECPVFIEWNPPVRNSLPREPVPPEIAEAYDEETIRASFLEAVRTVITPGDWKLNYSSSGVHELYNLAEDPMETRNTYRENPGRVRKLRELIRQWQEKTGDCAVFPRE